MSHCWLSGSRILAAWNDHHSGWHGVIYVRSFGHLAVECTAAFFPLLLPRLLSAEDRKNSDHRVLRQVLQKLGLRSPTCMFAGHVEGKDVLLFCSSQHHPAQCFLGRSKFRGCARFAVSTPNCPKKKSFSFCSSSGMIARLSQRRLIKSS